MVRYRTREHGGAGGGHQHDNDVGCRLMDMISSREKNAGRNAKFFDSNACICMTRRGGGHSKKLAAARVLSASAER